MMCLLSLLDELGCNQILIWSAWTDLLPIQIQQLNVVSSRTGTWSSVKTASSWTRQIHWPSWPPISPPSPSSDNKASKALPGAWPQALPLTGTKKHTQWMKWGLGCCIFLSQQRNCSLQPPSLWRHSTVPHSDSSTMNKAARSQTHSSHVHVYSLPINIAPLCNT